MATLRTAIAAITIVVGASGLAGATPFDGPLAQSATGSSPAVGPTLDAPYDQAPPGYVSSLLNPCRPATAPVDWDAAQPDGARARLDLSNGIAARGCAGHARTVLHRWDLGAVPDALVGRPGTVVVDLTIEHVRRVARGSAVRTGSVALRVVPGGAFDGAYRSLWDIRCTAGGCRGAEPTVGHQLRVSFSFDALPERLQLDAKADTAIRGRRGGALGMVLRSVVDAVTIQPAIVTPRA